MGKDIFEIINERASCRNFLDKEIPDDIMDNLLDTACKSPSAGGFQNYSIIKVTDKSKKEKLADLCRGQKFIGKAPVDLVFCIDFRRIKKVQNVEPFPFQENERFMMFWMSILDTAISAHTLTLASEAFGLKSVYLGNIVINMDKVSELLELPKYVVPSIMLTLGYPSGNPELSPKYPKKYMIHENTYKDYSEDEFFKIYKEKYKDWKLKPKDKMLNKLHDTAEKYKDKDFADKCVEYAKKNNKLSCYQYWYGNWYLYDGFMRLDDYVEFMHKKGFKWI